MVEGPDEESLAPAKIEALDAETPADRPRKAKRRRKRTPKPPPSESELNSPSRQTLFMLAVVFGISLVSWSGAKIACNAHPPELQRAKPASLERLGHAPKGAAAVLQYRFLRRDYAAALELADGALAEELKREHAACKAQGPCSPPQEEDGPMAPTVSVLLREEGDRATTRVATTLPAGEKRYEIDLQRVGTIWKGIERRPAQ